MKTFDINKLFLIIKNKENYENKIRSIIELEEIPIEFKIKITFDQVKQIIHLIEENKFLNLKKEIFKCSKLIENYLFGEKFSKKELNLLSEKINYTLEKLALDKNRPIDFFIISAAVQALVNIAYAVACNFNSTQAKFNFIKGSIRAAFHTKAYLVASASVTGLAAYNYSNSLEEESRKIYKQLLTFILEKYFIDYNVAKILYAFIFE